MIMRCNSSTNSHFDYKKQNQTKTRINKEKGTYRLLKKCKYFDVLANFHQILHIKRSQTQECTQMQNYKYSHLVYMSTSPSLPRYEIGNVSEALRAYAILHSLLRI